MVLKLIKQESKVQRNWGNPDRTDIKDKLDETRWRHVAVLSPSGDASSKASSDGSGDSSLDGSTGREIEWIQRNFIIPL